MGTFTRLGGRPAPLFFSFAAASLVFSFYAPVMSFADDVKADALLKEAVALFEQRSDLAKNDQAIAILDQAAAQAEDSDLQYDIAVLASRAYYWKGSNLTNDADRMVVFQKGMDSATAAIAADEGYSEGHYYYGINLGRWAEAKGVMASLGRKDDLINAANTAKAKSTRDDLGGEKTDGYGPDRTLGRVYFKLPWLAGGSLERALEHLGEAYKNAPELALNVVYYAEALNTGNAAQKAQAKNILDRLLTSTPELYNPKRIPENRAEFAMARKLRSEMGD